jgi:hypothetical protein
VNKNSSLTTGNTYDRLMGNQTNNPLQHIVSEAKRLERELVPFLNLLREIQGKEPVILPGERRTRER